MEEPGAFGCKRSGRKEDGSLQDSCSRTPSEQGAIHALAMHEVWEDVDCPKGWRQGQCCCRTLWLGGNSAEEFVLVSIGNMYQNRLVQKNFGEEQQFFYIKDYFFFFL